MTRTGSMIERVRQYLRDRRATGVRLRIEGQQLLSFACFADRRRLRGPLTVALALRWACASSRAGPVGRARRLEVIRPFARYLSIFDEQTEIPALGLLGPGHRRRSPYVYTAREISQLMAMAHCLQPAKGLRPITIATVLGLLASTGLRPSEAVALQDADVDFTVGVLAIRQTKFRKSRLVPLHPSATRALARYARVRNHHLHRATANAFFVVDSGRAVTLRQVQGAFVTLRRRLQWTAPRGRRPPRLYDLRHTFACRRLQQWYAEKIDVHNAVATLATYLGHIKVSDTYWYLSATPELMALAAARFEAVANDPHRRIV